MSEQELLDEVSKQCIQLLLKEPFYGHFFTGVVKMVSDKVPTAGVRLMDDLTIEMAFNSQFWSSLSRDHQYGVIKHEVLHIVLKHITERRQEKMPLGMLYNIAADLVVNQYVEDEMLLKGAIRLEQLQNLASQFDMPVEADESLEYYYQILREMMERGCQLPGHFMIKEEMEDGEWVEQPVSIEDIFVKWESSVENHSGWDDFEKLDDSQNKVVAWQIDRLIRNSVDRVGMGKLAGNIPAGLIEKIHAIINSGKANIDWRRALRMFTSSSRRTYLKNTMRRKSKRYGTTPGIKIKSHHHIMVGVDTSGSMSLSEIETFFSEIYHIWKQGAEVTVVEFDMEIQKVYEYRGVAPSSVQGRGGTGFDPVIRLANEKIHPDILVVFTDGYVDKVECNCRKPLMWMISDAGITRSMDYWDMLAAKGRVVKMRRI